MIKTNQGIQCLQYFLTTTWQCIVHTEPFNCASGGPTAPKVKPDCHKSSCQSPVVASTLQLCRLYNFSAAAAAAKLSAARPPKLKTGDKRACSICDIASVASIFVDRDHGRVLGPDDQKSGRGVGGGLGGARMRPLEPQWLRATLLPRPGLQSKCNISRPRHVLVSNTVISVPSATRGTLVGSCQTALPIGLGTTKIFLPPTFTLLQFCTFIADSSTH